MQVGTWNIDVDSLVGVQWAGWTVRTRRQQAHLVVTPRGYRTFPIEGVISAGMLKTWIIRRLHQCAPISPAYHVVHGMLTDDRHPRPEVGCLDWNVGGGYLYKSAGDFRHGTLWHPGALTDALWKPMPPRTDRDTKPAPLPYSEDILTKEFSDDPSIDFGTPARYAFIAALKAETLAAARAAVATGSAYPTCECCGQTTDWMLQELGIGYPRRIQVTARLTCPNKGDKR